MLHKEGVGIPVVYNISTLTKPEHNECQITAPDLTRAGGRLLLLKASHTVGSRDIHIIMT